MIGDQFARKELGWYYNIYGLNKTGFFKTYETANL